MATAEAAPSLLDALSSLRMSVESWASNEWRDVVLHALDEEIQELERLDKAA